MRTLRNISRKLLLTAWPFIFMQAQAQPDGYRLGRGNDGSMAIVPHAFKKVPYDALKDFTPVALMATNFMALAVGNTHAARTVGDLIQFAKSNPR